MTQIENNKEQEKTSEKVQTTIGLIAHVDAGKTTLSESILYLSGELKKTGRVDHGDAFLDTHSLERARGITIFSKQARIHLDGGEYTLLDTPGHVDFSTEMERTLQILDYGILVINGSERIQGHVITLWELLQRYQIPVFLFVNKMDQMQREKQEILDDLKKNFGDACMDFNRDLTGEEVQENLAYCDEQTMEAYLRGEVIGAGEIAALIRDRKLFPCFFGSALKNEGVEELLQGIARYRLPGGYGKEFSARVYKITRDEQGNRLTHMKITGGCLRVKDTILIEDEKEEKINQIRLYSGNRFEMVQEVEAGSICAVTGLSCSYAGQGLGEAADTVDSVMEPVLMYQIILPEGADVHKAFEQMKQLGEEDPKLHISWNAVLGEIYASVMGEVQIEVLKSLIRDRFGMAVEFGEGNIVYKETILREVEGVGHFEPLRHYAEVHLLMEPLKRGRGLVFESRCSEDLLDKNWQRLIMTHLQEREHPGVLTGSDITDIKITLVGGRAHLKHTEGGDFRQATYRAVRQGLKETECELLEPWYHFRLEVPADSIGRAMTDIQRMSGSFEPPMIQEEWAVLEGEVPVSEMREYQREVNSYTRGEGRLSCRLKGYDRCHDPEKVMKEIGYDSESDPENPTGSVFCSHGAGYTVSWDQVKEHMHVPSAFSKNGSSENEDIPEKRKQTEFDRERVTAKELEEIFLRTYGPDRRQKYPQEENKRIKNTPAPPKYKPQKKKEEYLLVDGYNIIFAWDSLKELAEESIDGARDKLLDLMSNYQGFRKCTLIVVFDAYKLQGHREEIQKYHNIYVVYTREAETADQYIEKTVHRIGRKQDVTVATSDGLEQIIIRGEGAHLLSARDLAEEIELANEEMRQRMKDPKTGGKNYLFNHADEKLAEKLEKIRLGEEGGSKQ